MIIGIGIDIIELDRIERQIDNMKFINRILTPKEQKILFNVTSVTRKVEFLAGRFAAKEAFSKAIGTGIGKISFTDIEVLSNTHGAPTIQVHGFEEKRIFISISHSKNYAVAQVIIEE